MVTRFGHSITQNAKFNEIGIFAHWLRKIASLWIAIYLQNSSKQPKTAHVIMYMQQT